MQNLDDEWSDDTRIAAGIRRADPVTAAPSETNREHIQALKDAGCSPAAILSRSQVIAFVSYQLRVDAGLRAIGESS